MQDVGFKRKADEDNQIYNWLDDPRAFELRHKQYELDQDARRKKEASDSKIMKGAEAAGFKELKKAEAFGIKEVKSAEAFVMKTDANANAIKIEAEAKVTEAEAKKTEAEAKKTEAEAKLLEFTLQQKQKEAGIATGAEPELCAVPLAIFANSKPRKPQTQQQIDENNKRRRERHAQKKLDKANANENL